MLGAADQCSRYSENCGMGGWCDRLHSLKHEQETGHEIWCGLLFPSSSWSVNETDINKDARGRCFAMGCHENLAHSVTSKITGDNKGEGAPPECVAPDVRATFVVSTQTGMMTYAILVHTTSTHMNCTGSTADCSST
jgi:hypothetical protein